MPQYPTGNHMKFSHVYIDTETTSKFPEIAEVIEVSAIEYNLNGEIGEEFLTLCYPKAGMIPEEATKVNNITIDMVKGKPNYLEDGVRDYLNRFIGERICDGHNFFQYDRIVIRIDIPKDQMIDTMRDYEKWYPKKRMSLKAACKNIGIEWDTSKSHRATYDVTQGIKLRTHLYNKEEVKKNKLADTPIFDTIKKESKTVEKKVVDKNITSSKIIQGAIGVTLSGSDVAVMATQSYSYSRINTFQQCPFKWYMLYVKKLSEGDKSYFTIGRVCHKVAEYSGQWVYRMQFAYKFQAFFNKKKMKLKKNVIDKIHTMTGKDKKEITPVDFGLYLKDNPKEVPVIFTNKENLSDLIITVDSVVKDGEYECPNKPDEATYDILIQKAMVEEKCNDAGLINEVQRIVHRFYYWKDFRTDVGDIMMFEKKLAFDKDWNEVDFYDKKAYIRGILDFVRYEPSTGTITIIDYKSSRKMLEEKNLKNENQLKVYVLLICKLLGKNAFKKIIIQIDYMRFSKSISYEAKDAFAIADEAKLWIDESVTLIESELQKDEGHSFKPRRNEYCHTCFLGEDGRCPLFDKRKINNIDDPYNYTVTSTDECVDAWKRIEANKAENSRLLKQCKSFTSTTEVPIVIDDTARLATYAKYEKGYDSTEMARLLIGKGIDISKFIEYFNVTKTGFEKISQKLGVSFTDEEIEEVSYRKRSSEFKALTLEEIDKGDLISE